MVDWGIMTARETSVGRQPTGVRGRLERGLTRSLSPLRSPLATSIPPPLFPPKNLCTTSMSRPLLRTFVRPVVRCLLATSHPAPPPPATVRLLSTSLSSCSLIPQRSYSTATESVASPSSSSAPPIPPSTWATSESIRVVPPSLEAIRELEEEGIDVPLIPENQATLNVTPSAWKVRFSLLSLGHWPDRGD